jgi:hypothetical protein
LRRLRGAACLASVRRGLARDRRRAGSFLLRQ